MIQHSVSTEDHGCNYLDKIQWLLNVIGVRGHFLALKKFSEFVFWFWNLSTSLGSSSLLYYHSISFILSTIPSAVHHALHCLFRRKGRPMNLIFLPIKKLHVKNFSDSQVVTFSASGEWSLFTVPHALYDLKWAYSDQKGQDL